MITKENYNDLYAFLMVTREGSFTKAAGKLGVSQSALSHTIRGLEERLGMLLLTRTTRSVSPTEAGERLRQTISASFDRIDNELSLLSKLRDTPAGTVRINASSHAIRQILLPKLQQLTQHYPDINIELTANSGMVDIVAERFDAGVRFGSRVAEGMVAVRIGNDVKMAVVATPDYFAKHGLPQSPQELTQHSCIGFRLTTQGGIYAWEFEKDGLEIKIKINGQWVFNESYHSVDAVRLGLGIAYIPEDMVEDDLRNGRLIKVLDEYSIQFSGYHLYYPHRRQQSPALRLVIDTLRLTDSAM
ncbi:LysR family transcriptional regulator [Acinetobacter sp. VNH17]|uniref:LysR family transcriptional regulator n=1 Tax=Acinetobacter thutiue TaxID=2998078 RepID=A0ABT7WN50_9GAMM|nr:LysR family transcriptional regulator [Acinetobacter thutiue]MCY6412003.1 LysR family transcriptional regulator [Acinetobacter thutiue]MDN0014107.1 LysR family transcriptional regulator [Acinetobacter thutiue]